MENRNIIVIILIMVIALVLASVVIPIVAKMPQPEPGKNPGQQQNVPPTQQPTPPSENVKTVISFINIALIIPLFIIYAGIYRKMKSSFTLGLMAVIFALGMYAVTSNPLLVSLMGGRPEFIGLFQIIPDLCATAALIILIYISLE
jgi:tellurite resistance protein TehA-like permease